MNFDYNDSANHRRNEVDKPKSMFLPEYPTPEPRV